MSVPSDRNDAPRQAQGSETAWTRALYSRLDTHPTCRPEAVVQGEHFRITVLTESLLRLEYSAAGRFEDRATQTVLRRDFAPVRFTVEQKPDELLLRTAYLELHYDRAPFTPEGLYICVKGIKNSNSTWHYGDAPDTLGGTARTLDTANGEIPLEPGVLSRSGYATLDDSRSMVITEDGWIAPRQGGAQDLYFFGYGHRYQECLRDFYALTGKTPLIPRYALGNWWSRYHAYTQEEYRQLMERFAEEKLPFTVSVIDMDWHLVDEVDEKYGSGWTGFTWNKRLFPDHVALLDWLHGRGMHVSLNLHPADGVRAFEDAYPAIAEAMGIDPASGLPVTFEPSDARLMEAYFKKVLHPLEEEGVDFWWIDWQQGSKTRIPGLDPLWVLNHCHYLDSARRGKRPMTFSRYAGPGSHRYPIGFSGDTVISWESLDFQPFFTSTASNIGYGWWSHDIGGHMLGERNDEMTARWVQYGVFSPICRLHSSNNPFLVKEPWKYGPAARAVIEDSLRLRHRLIPYLYAMNRRASREGLPLVQPMYYLAPEQADAYDVPNEYAFGSELLVAAVTTPMNAACQAAPAKVWLPEGLYADFFSGVVYQGGRTLSMWRPLSALPVLMKAGAIVPLAIQPEGSNDVSNPAALELRIFPAAPGRFTLWEDAGDTPEDLDSNWAATEIAVSPENGVTIAAATGNLTVLPQARSWRLSLMGTANSRPEVHVNGVPVAYDASYDPGTHCLSISLRDIPVTQEIVVRFPEGLCPADNDVQTRCFALLEQAQMDNTKKARAYAAIEALGKQAIATLLTLGLDEGVLGALVEILTAQA